MFRALSFAKAPLVVVSCLMLLTPASSFAQSRYERQTFPEERATFRSPVDVWLSGEGWDEDFSSSHVCINGYRWITRDTDPNASAAQNAYPVRC